MLTRFLQIDSVDCPPTDEHQLRPRPSARREGSEGLRDVMDRYRRYVADHFFRYQCQLPASFSDTVCNFMEGDAFRTVHVATLNYDNLLYDLFLRRQICKDFSGKLVDGFGKKGFDASRLERRWGNRFGWYLHLHGSPLFVEDESGTITKLSQGALARSDHSCKHLVLAHADFKQNHIVRSSLLVRYFEYLTKALDESSHLVLFGYSGLDPHVNTAIQRRVKQSPLAIDVVEWNRADTHAGLKNRRRYWTEQLGHVRDIYPVENILGFRLESLKPAPSFQANSSSTPSSTVPSGTPF